MPVARTRAIFVFLSGVAMLITACSEVPPAAPTPALPAPPPVAPAAKMIVTVDPNGSMYALSGITAVSFDLSASAGAGLSYVVDYGDGTSSASAVSTHVYALRGWIGTAIATATVTDILGRSDSTTVRVQTVTLSGSFGYWRPPYGQQGPQLTFASTPGRSVEGSYYDPMRGSQKFTGSVTGSNEVHLVLDDGVRLDGRVVLIDDLSSGLAFRRKMPLRATGGANNGTVLDFEYDESY